MTGIRITRRAVSAGIAVLAMGLAAGVPQVQAEEAKKIVLLVNGSLGDRAFFDSGAEGIAAIKAKHGDAVETKIIEMGTDQTKWLPTLEDVSEQGYDLIYAITFQMVDPLADVATRYPDQKYVLVDGTMDYEGGQYGNVYSVLFKQNEGSYLAGMLAAGLVRDGTIPADKGTNLGFLGAMDIPVINDFLVGYIEGAKAVTPDVKIAVSYANSFDDSAKGKELALAQYRAGTAIGFHAAGTAGLGQFAAAKEADKLAIGVNSDEEAAIRTTDPEMADKIVSSMLKRVDVAVSRSYDLMLSGELPFGKSEVLGIAEGTIGLAETDNLAKIASAELKADIEKAKAAIIAGEITVGSAFGMDTAAIGALRDAVRP
jgi:basic membrane protein A